MRIIALLLMLGLCIQVKAQQSLGAERIAKLKSSVARVLIDGNSAGTAFFIMDDENGRVATCFHVFRAAMIFDSLNNYTGKIRNIEIELYSKERVQVDLVEAIFNPRYADYAIGTDFCILSLLSRPKTKFTTLKLGSLDNINEGDLVYSAGFPLTIKQLVPATGIVSSKWQDPIVGLNKQSLGTRNVAWLDLSMNRGNSGGPVIKFGKSPEEDEVVGIATFILNPYGQAAESLFLQYKKDTKMDVKINGDISLVATNALLTEAVSNNSLGVGGMVSAEYLLNFIIDMQSSIKTNKVNKP